jgi:hypothetical protein
VMEIFVAVASSRAMEALDLAAGSLGFGVSNLNGGLMAAKIFFAESCFQARKQKSGPGFRSASVRSTQLIR